MVGLWIASRYSVLKITDDMLWVEASYGKTPTDHRPVKGGVDAAGRTLFHAVAMVGEISVPGMVSPALVCVQSTSILFISLTNGQPGASFIWEGEVYIMRKHYKILSVVFQNVGRPF